MTRWGTSLLPSFIVFLGSFDFSKCQGQEVVRDFSLTLLAPCLLSPRITILKKRFQPLKVLWTSWWRLERQGHHSANWSMILSLPLDWYRLSMEHGKNMTNFELCCASLSSLMLWIGSENMRMMEGTSWRVGLHPSQLLSSSSGPLNPATRSL